MEQNTQTSTEIRPQALVLTAKADPVFEGVDTAHDEFSLSAGSDAIIPQALALAAYKHPRFSTKEAVEREVKEFGSAAYLRCFDREIE